MAEDRVGAPPAWLRMLCWAAAALALLHLLVIAAWTLDAPLLDQHAFRQTQTALSAYWLARGGAWLAYETPVLGSPWAIPFEFPLFQLLTLPLTALGIPLDAAGRLGSLGFMLACYGPLRMLWRDLALPAIGLPIACALILGSPEYLFWSRSFMIETTALFFSGLWLALLVRFLSRARMATALAAVLAGALAALAKATTLPAFALLGGLLVLPWFWRSWRTGQRPRPLGAMIWAGVILFAPFAIGIAWTRYADLVKLANPLGQSLTSQALAGWNYGTLAQRVSGALWISAVKDRMLPDFFGSAWPLAVLLLAGACLRRQTAVAAAMMALGFLVPIMLFTNLHIVHNYYQTANAIFLLTAVAVGIAALAVPLRLPVVAAFALVVILFGQYQRFRTVQAEWLTLDGHDDPAYRIALEARARLPADGSLLVLGEDWSSLVPYYARRKALALPPWTPPDRAERILHDPAAALAGTRFAGVVDCTANNPYPAPVKPLVDAFLQGRAVLAEFGACRLLSADR